LVTRKFVLPQKLFNICQSKTIVFYFIRFATELAIYEKGSMSAYMILLTLAEKYIYFQTFSYFSSFRAGVPNSNLIAGQKETFCHTQGPN
jgi:hypothetical protein